MRAHCSCGPANGLRPHHSRVRATLPPTPRLVQVLLEEEDGRGGYRPVQVRRRYPPVPPRRPNGSAAGWRGACWCALLRHGCACMQRATPCPRPSAPPSPPMQRAPDHTVWGEVACLLSRKRDAIQPLQALGLLPGEVRAVVWVASLQSNGALEHSTPRLLMPLVAAASRLHPRLRCPWHGGSCLHLEQLSFIRPTLQVPLASALPFLEGALWGASERRRAAALARNLRRSEHVSLLGQLADERQR